MKVCARRFNLFLTLTAALALFCGCQTDKNDARDKVVAALRVHIEVNADNAGALSTAQTISVLRSDPVLVTIAREPVLTEANVITARVIEAQGGFAVEIRFDESSAFTLEEYSAANPGKHFVIFGGWSDLSAESQHRHNKKNDSLQGRWLAAPLITQRIANGVLAFTPDCSREEADQMALGLNNVSKKIHKGMFK